MKTLLILLLGMLLCGSGAAQAESYARSLPQISAVEFALPGELIINFAQHSSQLVIECEPAVFKQLQITTEQGRLRLSHRGRFQTQQPLRFALTVPSLQRLTSLGSGDVRMVRGDLPQLSVIAAGSGTIQLEQLQTRQLQLILNGSGVLQASGQGQRLTIELNGSGEIDSQHFMANQVTALLSGSGNISLHAIQQLDTRISGAGMVQYAGTPRLNQQISGAGSVEPL